MACGHTANALQSIPGNWADPIQREQMKDKDSTIAVHACVICSCNILQEKLCLCGRKAKCADCNTVVDSDYSLAFFEYRGPGSYRALNMCKRCMYARGPHKDKIKDHLFVPHGPYEQDEYYCGCKGWD